MANKINIYNSSAIYDSMVKDGFLKADKLSKEKFLNALEYNPKYMPRVRAYAQRVYGMSPEDFDNLVYTTDYTQDVSQLPPSGSPDYAPSMPWDNTPAQFSLPYKTKPGSDNNLPGLPAHDNTSQPNFMRDLSPENVTRRALANATPQPMQYIPKEEWDKEIRKKEAIQQGLQEIAAHSTRSTTDYSQPISVKSVTHPSDLTLGEWYNSFASDTYSIQKEAGRIYQMWQVGAIDEDEARSRFHQLYVSPQTAQSRNFVRTIDERRNFRRNNAAIDAAEAEITKKLQAAAAQKPTQPIPMPYMGDARISDSIDEQYYKQSLRFLDDARKISRAYADNNYNGTSTAQRVLRGIGDNLITPEAITMGFSAIADNANLMRILEKDERGEQLSDAEETLLSAAIIKQYTEAAYASGAGIAYNIGAVTGESLPYMLSFVATGIPIKAATSGLSKRIVNFVGRQLQRKGIGRIATRATKTTLGLGGNIATSALQAPIMPSTYSDYLDRRIGTIDSTTDGMGNISFSHQGDSRSEAALKAYFNTFYQNFGERSGEAISSLWGMFGRGIGKIPIGRGKSINDIFNTIHDSRLGKFWDVMQGTAVADFMRQANYDGVFAEVVEEYISGILNAATIGDQSFEELFSQDNLLTTMGGIALTSVMLGSANATLSVAATQRIRTNFNRSSKAAQQYFSPEQLNQLIGVSGGSVQDITSFLAANIARRILITRQISQLADRRRNGETGIEAQINTLGAELQDLRMQYDFVNASAMYNAYIGGLSRRIEPMREQARAAIRANGDPATGLTIQVDINGRQGYLIGGNYNHIQDSDGNISVTPTGDLATVLFDGDKTPTPNIPMETISILGVRRTDDVIRDGDRAIFAATEQEENAAQAPATGSTVTVSGSQGNFILQGYDPQGNAIVTPLNSDGTPAVKNGNPITASVPSENIIPEEADNTSSSIRTGSIAYIDGIPYSVDQVDGENAIIHRLNTDGTPVNDEQGNPVTSIVPTATLSTTPDSAQKENDSSAHQSHTQPAPAAEDNSQPATQQAALSQTETDDNELPFVIASDGTTTFGMIARRQGMKTAPIKLSIGFNKTAADGKNHGYGLEHIESAHGRQIRDAGFLSVPQFVEHVAKHYNSVKKGKTRNGKDTFLLELTDSHNNTLFIELANDGSYWNVNSAGIFRKEYSQNKETVPPLPAVRDDISDDDTGVQSTTTDGNSMSGNSPATVSQGKDTQFPAQTQGNSPLERIPIDKNGKPIYEQSDPETAYDAILQQADGDTALASRVILSMIDNKEAALKKLSKAKPRRADNPADIINAEKELAAQIKQAESDLQFWKDTALVPSLRNQAQKEAEANSVIQDPSLANTPDISDDSPSDARKRGFRRYAGSRIDRSEPLHPATQGNTAEIRFSAKQVIPVHAAVIEADEIIPSHINGQRNPKHFLDEAQPKERTDQASVMAARQIAADLRPEEITSLTTAYSGAPVINARGEVIQGNNRSAALREMWSSYPEQAARYRQYLIDHAAQLGIDPASIQNMKAPVLVAIADVSDQEAIRLGQYTQTDLESGGTERIKPQNAITAMGNNVKNFANILLQSTDENASLSELLDRNALAALKWMQAKGYITPTQYQSAVDARGNVTAEAKNDLRNILFAMAFKGAAPQLQSMFDNLPARAQRAILTTAYRDMENPEGESLIPELQNSIRAFHYLMQYPAFAAATNYKDARSAIEAWKRQFAIDDVTGDSFLPAEKFSNFALILAASYKGCPQSLIQNIFTGIYDIIQGSRQPNLFETIDNTPKSLQEAINTTIQELLPQEHNFNYNGTTRSNLLAGNSATSQQPRQGSDGTSTTGERAEDRNGESDNTGGTESNGRQDGISRRSREGVQEAHEELSDEQIDALLSLMESAAVEAPDIELTPSNWKKLFGEDGMVDTPVARVKMGSNQIEKLFEKGRSAQFGMIKPTLVTPLVVIEVPSGANDSTAERKSSLLYVKTFIGKDGRKIYYFKSVTVKKDGYEVSISSHYDRVKRIREALKKGKLLYRFDGDAQTRHLPADASVTTSPTALQGIISENKDNISSSNSQTINENTTSIQGLDGYTRSDITDSVREYIQQKLEENDITANIVGIEIHGSRARGNAKENSDLDVVVEYDGDVREDDMFNILNDDSNDQALYIEGIRVDINPIRAQETGTLDKYMERSRRYDEETLAKERVEEAKKQADTTNTQTKEKDDAPKERIPKAEKIEDVGEKIGGARKDIIHELTEKARKADSDKSSILDSIRSMPVSKIFNFDYERLRKDGVSNELITLLQVIREIIPSKPRSEYKLRRWTEQVFELYYASLKLITLHDAEQRAFFDKILGINQIDKIYQARMALGGFDSGLNTGKATLEELGENAGHYDKEGNWVSLKGHWYVKNAGKNGGIFTSRKEAEDALRTFAGENASPENSEKKTQFSVYRRNVDGTAFITVKGKPSIIVADGFKNSKEALDYLKTNYADLDAKYRSMKEKTNIAFRENRPRKGRDWRNGKNISAEEFRETFGFRGVEFGNWTNQEDRQQALNNAFDAFMDLADAIGKSPRSLSLNGQLGIAFGARGGGRAAAHYEPDKVVINLTKTQGAGSLAHEWWHAIDNYFARRRGQQHVYNSDRTGYKYNTEKKGAYSENERQELTDAFKELMNAIDNSSYGKRSKTYASMKSSYWSRPTELGARAFAIWIERKLSERGTVNDFLANNPTSTDWGNPDMVTKYYPYPIEGDFDTLDTAFDNLFNAIQEEVDATTGNTILFREIPDQSTTQEQTNDRFNNELQQQIDGTLPKGHIYDLGMPSDTLLNAGLPNLPIEMAASRLSDKSMQENHPFDLSEIRNLPKAIQSPMAIFRSATHLGSFVVMTEIEHHSRNFVVAIQANRRKGRIEVNSIRSVYPKNNNQIANWVTEGLLEYADKKRMVEWLSKQRSNSADVRKLFNHATNIIQNFDNPKNNNENIRLREMAAEVADAARPAQVTRQIERLAREMNLPIEIIHSIDDIPDEYTRRYIQGEIDGQPHTIAGYYDRTTGKAYIILPAILQTADPLAEAERTILHEVIAHHGMQALMGRDAYDTLCDEVWNSLPYETRARFAAYVLRKNPRDLTITDIARVAASPALRRAAADEYIAALAEGGVENPTLWQRIKAFFRAILRRIHLYSINPTDADIRFMLSQARENLAQTSTESIHRDTDIRLSEKNLSNEEQEIIDRAKADGTYLKAPNGEETNLTPRQWVQVRTQAFKQWFGDWEKAARIEKLRHSKPVIVKYNEEYQLNRDSAKQWLKDNIRGEYVNKDTGEKIIISKIGINEVTSHGTQNESHLKSLSAIPQMIENSVFIDELPNTKEHDKYDSYRYYVVGMKIDNVDYTAKIVVGVKGDSKYYDHRLTQIEKGTLIDNLNGLSNSVAENQNAHDSISKDSKLLSILQTNASKVVDTNGEPLVVYHGSRNFNPLAQEQGRAVFHQGNDGGIHFGTLQQANIRGGDGNANAFFLNIRNIKRTADRDNHTSIIREAKKEGYDGTVYNNIFEAPGKSFVVFSPSQIKSATSNTGAFSSENPDIRFKIREEEPPKMTGIGYKVFVLRNGKLYPPMVANPEGADTPVGVWLDADAAPVAGQSKTGRNQVKAGGKGTQGGSGKLAYRPGGHLGEIPYALQFNRMDENGNKELFPANFVWAEVEYADDVDYQDEAMSYGMNANGKFQHSLAGLPRVPQNGSYRYRTNPNPETDPWIITGAMRVNRLLTPSEVDYIVKSAGREPQRRQAGAVTDEQINKLNQQLLNKPSDTDIRFRELSAPEETMDNASRQGNDYARDARTHAAASIDTHNPDLSPVEQAEAVRFRELLTRDFSAASDFLNSANLINAAMQANDGKAAWLNNIQEAVFDSMLRLRLLLDRMKKDGASIPAGFNPYLAENQSRSRAQNRIAAFNEDYRRPLIESLAKCINKLREENIGVAIKDNNAAHEALSLYAQARAAVERQEVKEREAREQAKADGTEYKHREWAGLPGIQYAIIALYKGEITDDVEANKNNLQWLQDFATENNIPTVEQYITMVEDALQKENIDNLWENIRRISEFQLTTSRDAGILSRGSYQLLTYGYNIDNIIETLYKEQRKKITDDINNGIGDKDSLAADLADLDRRHLEAVATATDLDAPDAITTLVAGGWITQDIAKDIHRYYNYYLPLKGHAEITGEDLFDYNTPSMPRNASRIKSVRGHEQLARDPFNQILRDAEGCIMQAERNRWKQQLYHVLSTNRSLANGQYAIQRKYYQVIKLDDGTVRYEPYQRVVTTENNEDIITFVPTSEEIAAGTAVLLNSSAKFDIYVSQKQRSEHETIVYIDGSPISILFYDARIAKAVNGTNEAYPPQRMPRAIIQASRTIPALLTSWHPEFVLLSNPIRDTQEAIANAAIDKGFKYTALLARNLATVDRDLWAYTGGNLKQKKDNGQPLSQYEKYVVEFFENGGSVNVTQLSDYETTTKDLKKELKRALKGGKKPSKNFWKRLTEQTELRSRIATYITSRQTGSTIQDAINDAKEITVNFDRRGAQFRNFNLLQMFFNAQMQSVRRQTELMRRHPVRYATTVAILASSKVLIGLGISLLLGGGDDDNTTAEDIIRRYFEINKQLRTRNHIFIIDGEVYHIPVAPAFIPFTTLCEEAAQLAFDPSSRHRNTASQALLSVTSSVLETYVPTLISDPANIMININNEQAWRQSFASGIPMSGRALWQPFIEAIYNYDYTGNPIYTEPQFGAQHLPFHRDYRERTGKAYVYTSKLLSDLTGGNNIIPGKINIHPEQIEHVVQGLAGGIGTLAGRFTGIYKRVQGESAESTGLEFLYDIPFAARLYGGNMQQRENRYYQSLFFDDKQALEAFRAQQRFIESSKDMQDFNKEYNSDTRKYFYDFATADKLAAKVRKWRDAHQKGSPEYKQYEAILQDIYRTTDDAFNRLQQSNDNEPYEIIDNPYYIYNNIESQLDKELYNVNGTFMTIDDAAMAWAARTGRDKKQYYTLSGDLRQIAKIRDEVKEIKKLFKEIGSDYYPGMPLNGRQQYIYRKIEQKTKALSSLYDETEFDNIQLIE